MPIGGHFEIELNDYKSVFHNDAILVNTGRNALEYILLSNKINKIYIPYYSCDAILEPIRKLNVNYDFYNIENDFSPALKSIGKDEYILFINYYGILNSNLSSLKNYYDNIVVDNSQAFFSSSLSDIPSFYSPRKFFGIPDGGIVYSNNRIEIKGDKEKSIEKFSHLLIRLENGPENSYRIFQDNEKKLSNIPLREMSTITRRLLQNIDYENIRNKRNENFGFLHKHLRQRNELTSLIDKKSIDGPMVYPYLVEGNKKLREYLINNKVYVATYWANVFRNVTRENYEYYLTQNLIPLPIDQRYSKKEMEYIINLIGLYGD